MSSANSFGSRFILSSFGESHGSALGALIDGCPAGVIWDEELLLRELARRKPGQKQAGRESVVTDRQEADHPEVLSGVYEGKTLGTPISILIRNQDARSKDYEKIASNPRAGHADDVWKMKFNHSDPRGGGRSSGRETVSRVIGGAVAQMFLRQAIPGFKVVGFAKQIGPFKLGHSDYENLERQIPNSPPNGSDGHGFIDNFVARFPSFTQQDEVEKLLVDAKKEGRSYGGVAEIWLQGVPPGLGQPVFHKLKADLAAAMMSVGATSSFEVGAGLDAVNAEGAQFHLPGLAPASDSTSDSTHKYGGIRGGISTGERIVLRIGFKPTSSVMDVAKQGRHDPCIVTRAIPVLESMAALVIADHLLWLRQDKI